MVDRDLVHDGPGILELLRQIEEIFSRVQEQRGEFLVAPAEDGCGDLGAFRGIFNGKQFGPELSEEVYRGLRLARGVFQ